MFVNSMTLNLKLRHAFVVTMLIYKDSAVTRIEQNGNDGGRLPRQNKPTYKHCKVPTISAHSRVENTHMSLSCDSPFLLEQVVIPIPWKGSL
jgi:hypothetical protein